MRFFPSASRPRLAAALAAVLLATGMATVPPASADDDLKKRRHQVEKQLEHAHDELEHSSAEARAAGLKLQAALGRLAERRRVLATAQAKVEAAAARDAQMRQRLAEAEERLRQARADVAAGQKAVAGQRRSVRERIVQIYQGGDPRLVALSSVLDATGPADMLRRANAGKVVVDREAATLDELRATEILLEVREGRVADARAEVARQRAAAAEHLREMAALRDSAAKARSEVEVVVTEAAKVRRAAYVARQRDRDELARLKKQEQAIRAKILAQARRAGAGYTGASNGFFDAPTSGGVTSPYGRRKHPIYGYWGMHDGTDFGAGCGTPLRAVATGRVASSFYSTVYGNRLYLNVGKVNGKFITAVYNHATRYTVGVGDVVRRGQVIGYVGSTGWSTGCHLHFTVLADGNITDPMAYL